jgi:hypothetical protein
VQRPPSPLTAHLPLAPGTRFFEMLADTAAATGGDRAEHAERYAASLRSLGATHVTACFYLARAGRGRLAVEDLADGAGGSLWFR